MFCKEKEEKKEAKGTKPHEEIVFLILGNIIGCEKGKAQNS